MTFISSWKTDNPGTSNDDQVTLPIYNGGTYNFNVDWGDSSNDDISAWDDAAVTHTYASAGTYTVTITGTINGWRFNNSGDKLKIINVSQWGILLVGNLNGYFYGCSNMTCNATDTLNTSNVTNMFYMFYDCSSFNQAVAFNTSNVTNMSYMFYGCNSFNQAVAFDTSNVTNMSLMFRSCSSFSQAVAFNTSNVTNMSQMFRDCSSFNQAVTFDTSNVTNMSYMFRNCSSFNQAVAFDTSNVTNMFYMFYDCSVFNQAVAFNTSNVTNMSYMFRNCSSFNQAVAFDTSNVTNMSYMFRNCSSFNQDIAFDTSNVTNMSYMFYDCSVFNQDISSLDVSSVTDMTDMLFGVTLSVANYDALLVNWAAQAVQNGVTFHGGNSKYSVDSIFAIGTLELDAIGATHSTPESFVNGNTADLLIFNRVLSISEIQQLADPSNVMLSGLIVPPQRKWW